MSEPMKFGRTSSGRTVLVTDSPAGSRLVDIIENADPLMKIDAEVAKQLCGSLSDGWNSSWEFMIESWSEVKPLLEAARRSLAAGDGSITSALSSDVALGPPLPSPRSRYFAHAANFAGHVAAAVAQAAADGRAFDVPYGADEASMLATKRSEGPSGFLVLADTIVGHGAAVSAPPGIDHFDFEVEVAFVLGRGGRGIPADGVSLWGYSVWNDFSLRDCHLGVGEPFDGGVLVWALQKNFDNGSSFGPWVVVPDQLDPDQLGMSLTVNGEERQSGTTADMIFGIRPTVHHVSRFLTLRAGDVFTSGTPDGTAIESGLGGPYLVPGDIVEASVEGVGSSLRNFVV